MRVRALACLLALTLAALASALFPALARAVSSPWPAITIHRIAEDEFEDPGYSWSIDFTGLESERGFSREADIGRYMNAYGPVSEGNESQFKDTPGWAAFIDEDTPKGSFSLRYTGGSYGNTPVDAVVTLSDWTYVELPGGWESDGHYVGPDSWWENFRPGVFVAEAWKTPIDGEDGFQSFSFYTVGLYDLTVDVSFVYAGTNRPVPSLKGHLTTTDIDVYQRFAFGGACFQGNIAAKNDTLEIVDNGTTVDGGAHWLDDQDPTQYRDGLVEAYFDTGDAGEGLRFWFGTSYGAGDTVESVFFLNAEFITTPPASEEPTEISKSADRTEGVSVGDEVEFTVDYAAHEQGVNCRWGYHYTGLDLVDVLPAEMRYVDGSGRLYDEGGADITERAGSVAYEGNNESPTENTVRFEFDPGYLLEMPMLGERYRFVFRAVLTEYPWNGQRDEQNQLYVRNSSYALVNNTDENHSNDVDVRLLEPVLEVDKRADAYEYEVDDVITYTVTYRQTVDGAQARQTIVSDNLPEGLELVEGSVSATGMRDLPAPEVSANRWSIDLDKFGYGDTLTVTYQARALQSGNGREIVNNAGAHAVNAMDADDPAEVYVNTAALDATKEADRYEGHVGASDRDPGFFEYTVRLTNTKEGTVANDVVVMDDSLPEGMRLARNADGSMMVKVSCDDGSEPAMGWAGDRAEGSFSGVDYRVGNEDDVHDQREQTPVTWALDPAGTGWRLRVSHLDHGRTVTVTYRAYPEDGVSGWEVTNDVEATAANSLPDSDTARVWVNQPHLVVEKRASNDSFTVNDEISYHVRVTNSTPGTLGRDLVVSDLAHTQGVELERDTIRVYDSRGEDVTESCVITYKHAPQGGETFIVETGRDLVCGTGERPVWEGGAAGVASGENPLGEAGETEMVVEYRVKVADADLAGQTVDNTALAVTDEPNTATTDDEVVDVKGPRLSVVKSSDKDLYQVGETAHYALAVTQTREDVVARGVVVKDLMDEPGIGSIVEGSVRATGPDGAAIEAEPAYVTSEDGRIVGFELATGADLADEQALAVTYDVLMETAGRTLSNKAQATAENSLGGVDDNQVKVVDPYAAVTFEKDVDREVARVGETVTYTLTASVADREARDVVVSDRSLPESVPVDLRGIRLQVNGRDVGDFRLDVEGNGFAAHVGDLSAGDVATITYQAQLRDASLKGTSVVNTAYLTAATLPEPLRADAHVTVPADEPAIALEKRADRDVLRVGETVSYEVEATVSDEAEGARRVVIADESLPDAMRVDMSSVRAWLNGVETSPVSADVRGNAFSVAFGDLRAGETVRLAYSATATDESLAGTTVTNVATLTSEDLDEPLEATARVRVAADGETTLDKHSVVLQAGPGDRVAYSVTAVAGTDLAEAVLTDSGLPEGVRIDPATVRVAVNDTATDIEAQVDGNAFSASLGGLRAGDVVVVTYEAVVDAGAGAGEATNTAALSSPDLADPVEDTETVELLGADPADDPTSEKDPATVEKTADRDELPVGETVTYSVRVEAAADLANATLSDAGLPEGVTVDEGSLALTVNGSAREGAKPVFDGSSFAVDLGDLAAQDVVELSYRATVTDGALAGQTLENTATLDADGLDEPLSSTARVTVTAEDAGDAPDDAGPSGGGAPQDGSTRGTASRGGTLPNTGQGPVEALGAILGLGAALVAASRLLRRR